MRFWRIFALTVFVLGALLAVFDLLEVSIVKNLDNLFLFALICMTMGVILAFIIQARKQA